MKIQPLFALSVAGALLIGASGARAEILLDDHFNNGDLASNPDTGAGFGFLDNGQNAGTGSITESDSQARIVEGSGSNTSGILSTNKLDLTDPNKSYTVTWTVARWTSSGSSGTRRAIFTLQSNNSFVYSTAETEASRIALTIDEAGNNANLTYQNRSAGNTANVNFVTSNFALGSAFAGDTDGFTVTLVLNSSGYSFTTTGLSTGIEGGAQVNLSGAWADLSNGGTNFNTALVADGNMHVGTYVQNTAVTGANLDLDRITLESSSGAVAANLSAGSSTVAPGTTVQLSWTASDYDTLTLDPGGIDAAALTSGGSGSTTVTVNATTTYTLTARLLGICFLREGFEAALGPERRGEKGGCLP